MHLPSLSIPDTLVPVPLIEQTPGHFIIYGLAVLTLIISYLIGVKYWAVPHIILANSNLTGSDGMLMSKLSKKQYGGKVFLARLPYYLMVILFIGLFVGTILIIQSITNYDNLLIVSVFSVIVPLILSLLWLVIYRIYISKCVKSYLIYQEVIKISPTVLICRRGIFHSVVNSYTVWLEYLRPAMRTQLGKSGRLGESG